MKPTTSPPGKPLIPKLVLGGLALLLLSWLVFMTSYLLHHRHRPPSAEPPPVVRPVAPPAAH